MKIQITEKQAQQFNIMLAQLKKISKQYQTPTQISDGQDSGFKIASQFTPAEKGQGEEDPFRFYENTFAISLENLKGSPDAEIKKDLMVQGDMDLLANALISMMEQHPAIEKLLCITVQNFLTRQQEINEN